MKIEKNIQLDVIVNEDNAHQYVLNTNDIEIKVRSEYVDSQYGVLNNLYIWAYHVRIENKSDKIVQLISRHFRIIDEKGNIQEVNSEGVVGEKPILAPQASFSYSSGVHLKYPSGIVYGHYEVKLKNGEKFNVKIPAFSLDVPAIKGTIN
jgi:ApaG protein